MSPFPITKTCGHARPRIEWGWIYDPKLAELDEMQFYVVQWAPNGKIYRHLVICANSDLRLRLGVRGLLRRFRSRRKRIDPNLQNRNGASQSLFRLYWNCQFRFHLRRCRLNPVAPSPRPQASTLRSRDLRPGGLVRRVRSDNGQQPFHGRE